MKERPIIFSAPMVRALLAGTKTQTRRQLRDGTWWTPKHGVVRMVPAGLALTGIAKVPCPYGQPGDRLWVREAWRAFAAFDKTLPMGINSEAPIWYEAQDEVPLHPTAYGKLRPSMYMPRWASRITLEITGVRVERLQDISEADAVAEGLTFSAAARRSPGCLGIYECRMPDGKTHFDINACDLYRKLWDQINGPGSWDANPWVWRVEFRRINAS